MPKPISYRKRLEVIFLHLIREGPKLSISKISRRLKISRQTVYRWLKRYETTGDVAEHKSPGRPSVFSPKIIKMIQNALSENRELTTSEIAAFLERSGVKISPRSISRRLNKLGFSYTKPSSKPLLTKNHRKKRLIFARENRFRNWNNVIFTDEATFKLSPNFQKIWRRRGTRAYQRTLKHPKKIHIWGCFSSNGFGRIVLFKENLNAEKLITIYKNGLLASYPEISEGKYILLEDNDPKHMSKLAKSYRKKKKIARIDFPPNSPDLNPIENVWSIMKKRIGKFHPSSERQLELIIRKIWNNLPQQMAQNLSNSMMTRLNLVIAAHGDVINY